MNDFVIQFTITEKPYGEINMSTKGNENTNYNGIFS